MCFNVIWYCRFLFFLHGNLIPWFKHLVSNRKNIKSRMPNFYHSSIKFISAWKISSIFSFKMCFSQFFADINLSRLMRNLQYCNHMTVCVCYIMYIVLTCIDCVSPATVPLVLASWTPLGGLRPTHCTLRGVSQQSL